MKNDGKVRWGFAQVAVALLVALALVGGLQLGRAKAAAADYGQGAAYQIEISANCVGPGSCIPSVVKGYGLWLWAELDADHTGDYEAADCGHAGPGGIPSTTGAFHDSGEVSWAYSADGSMIVITGVAIFGNTVPVTITVPAAYGHYSRSFAQVLDIPALGGALPGWAQVQVAP
jgi:hypothetical protein